MGSHQELAINVGEIARKKSGRNIPGFIVRWMEKFFHQDFINAFLTEGYEGIEFCEKCLEYLDIKLDVKGLEELQIPEGAKLTFASNHPLGGADGIAMVYLIGKRLSRPVKLVVNDFLMYLKGLAPMCVPVNKLGGQSRNLPQQIRQIYESDNDILMFPSGKCSRVIDGKVQDPKWMKSFIEMSVKTDRWIIPVHFIGQNSKRFYKVDKWCKKLGIKFNLAMMFLPDELYRAQHKTFKVVFGTPIPPTSLDSSKTPIQWAQTIREEAYRL